MCIQPKNVLWPTDFSPLSLKGAQYAVGFSTAFRSRLHVMHVCPVLTWSDNTMFLMTGGDKVVSEVEVLPAAKAQLQRLLAEQFDDSSAIVSAVVLGTPWYEICRYARDQQIDLIVIATHGATGLRHLLMGSTAERVVQHAHAPVLAVKSIERDFIREHEMEKSDSIHSSLAATT